MDLSYAVRGAVAGQRARERMKRTGKTPRGHWLWTLEEDEKVRALYPDYKALRKALRRRTFKSIKRRACDLGVAKKRHIWTGAELAKLRKLYMSATRAEILEAFSSMTWHQVNARARHAGYIRKRKPFKATGHEVLDTVRQRAFDLRLSMVDLDDMARTKEYFQKAGWHTNGITNKKAVMRAIEALDGEIKVQWR